MEGFSKVRCFQDLRVWREAHQFCLDIYRITKSFPKEEIYGLTNQIRRAAVSIAANIAEGSKRETTKDLCHFLGIAEASNEEVKCLLLLGRDLELMDTPNFSLLFRHSEAVGAMLNGLRRSLRT